MTVTTPSRMKVQTRIAATCGAMGPLALHICLQESARFVHAGCNGLHASSSAGCVHASMQLYV